MQQSYFLEFAFNKMKIKCIYLFIRKICNCKLLETIYLCMYEKNWLTKIQCIHTMMLYFVVKKNEIDLYKLIQSNFQDVLLNENRTVSKSILQYGTVYVKKKDSPGQVTQLVGASSGKPKSCGFDSWLRQIPRLWVQLLVGVCMRGN